MLHTVHRRLCQQVKVMVMASVVAACRWLYCPCGSDCSTVSSRSSVFSQQVIAPTVSSTNNVCCDLTSCLLNTTRYALYAKQCNVAQTFSLKAASYSTSENISHCCPDWLSVHSVLWFTTRKRGNCECIATWGRPSHASPLIPALITTLWQVWRRWTYQLPR